MEDERQHMQESDRKACQWTPGDVSIVLPTDTIIDNNISNVTNDDNNNNNNKSNINTSK